MSRIDIVVLCLIFFACGACFAVAVLTYRWLTPNLYDRHPLWSGPGRFWRCPHGSTGHWTCLACGMWFPLRYLKHRARNGFRCHE